MTVQFAKPTAPPTTVAATVTPWSTMPGWGIVADLTPPELIAARGLKALRRRIVAALVLVVLVCAGGFVWAASQASTADDRLAASRATTAQLTAQKAKYSGIVALQDATASLKAQVATLMTGDVDVAVFVARLHDAAPAGTVLTTTSISLNSATTAAVAGPTGQPTIGTGTMSGTSARMVDVAAYVTTLQSLPGVVNVVPSTNTASHNGGRAVWTITFELTQKLYTHRFDFDATGAGKTGGGHR